MTDAIVAIRNAVRPFLEECEAGDRIIVAVSGGADSLALAYAIAIESKPLALVSVGVTVDHQLQSASEMQAKITENQLCEMGFNEVHIKKVVVGTQSGIEAGARDARYQALTQSAQEAKSSKVFLGHTRDDQAETVLLGLARGSGTRSLSGMAVQNGIYIRPLLSITRAETERACRELGIDFWSDPHNVNTEFTRVKVRREILPLMEEKLGPGIAAALSRSASLLRDDADALDDIAEREAKALDLTSLDCSAITAMPRAIRSRILRMAIYAAGAPAGSISADHIASCEALVTSWSGQGALSLPGGVKVERLSGRISLSR
jgi:tRNA(Ile)-lysidine synthase